MEPSRAGSMQPWDIRPYAVWNLLQLVHARRAAQPGTPCRRHRVPGGRRYVRLDDQKLNSPPKRIERLVMMAWGRCQFAPQFGLVWVTVPAFSTL